VKVAAFPPFLDAGPSTQYGFATLETHEGSEHGSPLRVARVVVAALDDPEAPRALAHDRWLLHLSCGNPVCVSRGHLVVFDTEDMELVDRDYLHATLEDRAARGQVLSPGERKWLAQARATVARAARLAEADDAP
jgi:hypothetical protein